MIDIAMWFVCVGVGGWIGWIVGFLLSMSDFNRAWVALPACVFIGAVGGSWLAGPLTERLFG